MAKIAHAVEQAQGTPRVFVLRQTGPLRRAPAMERAAVAKLEPVPRATIGVSLSLTLSAHFVATLCRYTCRKSPQTAVSDKVGDEAVATKWIKTVVLGRSLAGDC